MRNPVYDVPCPFCEVPAGTHCLDILGDPGRLTPHRARIIDFRGGAEAEDKRWLDSIYPTLTAEWDVEEAAQKPPKGKRSDGKARNNLYGAA